MDSSEGPSRAAAGLKTTLFPIRPEILLLTASQEKEVNGIIDKIRNLQMKTFPTVCLQQAIIILGVGSGSTHMNRVLYIRTRAHGAAPCAARPSSGVSTRACRHSVGITSTTCSSQGEDIMVPWRSGFNIRQTFAHALKKPGLEHKPTDWLRTLFEGVFGPEKAPLMRTKQMPAGACAGPISDDSRSGHYFC